MAASVTANEAANTLRTLKQRPQGKFPPVGISVSVERSARDTNKRPRAASVGKLKQNQKKKTDTTQKQPTAVQYEMESWPAPQKTEEKMADGADVAIEDEGGGDLPGEDINAEIAEIAAKNEQLQDSVAALQHKFSLREEETHQLLLGLGALNAVANELTALQKDYQERSTKNTALIEESLMQISNCSDRVDTLKRSRGLTSTQLQKFRCECTQQINRLISRLGDLAETTYEPVHLDGNEGDVSCGGMRTSENRLGIESLRKEVDKYRMQVDEEGSSTSSLSNRTTSTAAVETTERINLALAQLEELHGEMYELKQCLVQENQFFRRHLENLVSRQMVHIREVQDNETERIYEEMDDIRSGMCGILKDMHRLKERTKYLVPSMARVGPKLSRSNAYGPLSQTKISGMNSGDQINERWIGTPIANHQSTWYSMTMASRQCQNEIPHYEHGYDGDCYCPGVAPGRMEVRCTLPERPRSSGSSISSPGHSDDDNWHMFPSEDTAAADQRVIQPCESPHYSSRSSSLSGHVSVYGALWLVPVIVEDHVVPNDEPSAEQCEQRLLEQHRLFWIGEGAG